MCAAIKNGNIIEVDHRPYFSVICPCYNSKPENIDILLRSISDQSIQKEDIEVILSDDCSDDTSYFYIVEKYKEDLNINIVKTDEDAVHCPGNNRENGIQYATGKWITFIDHDDLFTSDCFETVKKAIEDSGEEYMAVTSFAEVEPDNYTLMRHRFDHCMNWLHGKFYNLDNFWRAKDIHFVKDLVTHEDVAISSIVHCETYRLPKQSPVFIDIVGYLWRAHPDSLSRSDGYNFLNQHYQDYLDATGNIYLKDYREHIDFEPEDKSKDSNIEMHFKFCVDVFLFMYFYMQWFRFSDPLGHHFENEKIVKEFLFQFLNTFGKTRDDVYRLVSENKADWYNKTRLAAMDATGGFIEQESFKRFLYM